MQTSRSHGLAAGLSALALALLTACGGAGDAAEAGSTDGEIATLSDSTGSDGGSAADGAAAAEADSVDEAALELSQCLRDEGIDVPDIAVDADGNLQLREVFQEIGSGAEGLREAVEACADILEGIGFGAGGGGVRDDPAVADAFLEFSECIRDQGFEDVPDLTLQGGPGGDDGDGAPPEPGRGRGEDGFGDRNARLANRLELDPDDPEVLAALDECAPIIDNALAGAGVAGPAEG